MADIFSGMSAAEPMEICDAIGWHIQGEDSEQIKLIGAVMTLCRTVSELEAKVERLEAALKKEPRWRLVTQEKDR